MVLMLDACVLFTGLIGSGRASEVLATIRLGGFDACTVENAMNETRTHLLSYFNRGRLKFSPARADGLLKSLREAPTFDVHPWVTAPPELFPDNRKDAYLLEAIRRHRPDVLLTADTGLLGLGAYEGAQMMTPALLMDLEGG
jgi:predicted nucleic acid-binding protein